MDTSSIPVDPNLLKAAAARPARSRIGVAAHLPSPHKGAPTAKQAASPSLPVFTSLLPQGGHGGSSGASLILDPRLFELQNAVKAARSAKSKGKQRETGQTEFTGKPKSIVGTPSSAQQQGSSSSIHVVVDGQGEEEMDPNIREIVNSLANAQQQAQHAQRITDEQGAGSISAPLITADSDTIDQAIQSSLAEFNADHLHSLFPGAYSETPSAPFLPLPPESSSEAIPASDLYGDHATSSTSAYLDEAADADASSQAPQMKRGRGRPKGSKNKVKRLPKPPKPKPPKPIEPPKRIGRPPKLREGAELDEYERRKEERRLGIQRQRGRPRLFPGYLVREMRLKKNRDEFREVIRRYREDPAGGDAVGVQDGQAMEGGYGGADVDTIDSALAPRFDLDPELDGQLGGDADLEMEISNTLGTAALVGHDPDPRTGSESRDMNGVDANEEIPENYDWANDPQNLIDAVAGQFRDTNEGVIRFAADETGA